MATTGNHSPNRNVHFVSLNVKGINSWVKRQKIDSYLKQLKADVIFFQQTHLKQEHINLLRRGCHVFHSKFNGKARGAAIIVHKDVLFQTEEVIADPGGRFVIVRGHLFSVPVILMCVYAPNWDDSNFFDKLFTKIPSYNTYNLIIGGDFNCALNSVLDRSSNKTQPLSKTAKTINNFMDRTDMSDIWRFKFPDKKAFSFFSRVHHTYTRIDYFLLENRLLGDVNSCSYYSITVSDHGCLL